LAGEKCRRKGVWIHQPGQPGTRRRKVITTAGENPYSTGIEEDQEIDDGDVEEDDEDDEDYEDDHGRQRAKRPKADKPL
jgi:hypothetical protein